VELGQVVTLTFELSIVITVFGAGLSATRADVQYVLRRPRLLTVSLLAMFVVMPVVALALELYLDLPHAARVALVVIALSPVPQLLPRTEIASGGRASYAYGLAFAVSSLGLLLVPALVHFLGRVMSRPFDVPTGAIAGVLVPTVLLPLAVGMLTGRVLPRFAARVQVPLVRVANIALSAALLLLLIGVVPSLADVLDLRTILAMTAFVAAGLGVGHVMGGPDPSDAVVLAIACTNRNPAIAISVAAANFPTESFGPTVLVYALLVGIVTKPYIAWQRRRLATNRVAERGA
jgi:bile acid:Na+ symporter, BASS family